jgi:chromosome segregation protein
VVHLDQAIHGLQQRLTEAQLSVQGARNTCEHRQADLQRVRQEQQDTAVRIGNLDQQLESLMASAEQSRAERERQEALCREIGESAERLKARIVEAQEGQARDMAQANTIESRLDEVRKLVSGLQESRLTFEVRRAEVRTQLATVESTLSGTYQMDPGSVKPARLLFSSLRPKHRPRQAKMRSVGNC